MSVGTASNALVTDVGGDIVTGLRYVDTFVISCNSHLGTEMLKITKNTTNPGTVTIVTSPSTSFDWMATGL